jgi:peptidoglycan/LPS O-acetylase OafA/YrhL
MGHLLDNYFSNLYNHMVSVFAMPDGVSLFFCLSGFLVANSLLAVAVDDHVGIFASFWCRRAIRTIPPYIVALCIYNICISVFEVDSVGSARASSFVFVQNIAWPIRGGFPESWSLSVEEWFYVLLLFCPGVIFFLRRAPGRFARDLTAIAGVLIVMAMAYRVALAGRSYGGLDATWEWIWANYAEKSVLGRLDAPAFGVGAALLSHRRPALWGSSRLALWSLFCGVALIVGVHQKLWLDFFPSWLFERVGADDALPVTRSWSGAAFLLRPSLVSFGWALMLPFFSRFSAPEKTLGFRLVRRIAASAFSIYLWHYSIAMHVLTPVAAHVFGIAAEWLWACFLVIGVGGSQAFYHLVEKPFVDMKERVDQFFAGNPVAARRLARSLSAALLGAPAICVAVVGTTNARREARETEILRRYAATAPILGGACAFDAVRAEGDGIVVAGWAALPEIGVGADAVLIENGRGDNERRVIARNALRLDVAVYFKNDALRNAGFSAFLPKAPGTTIRVLQARDGRLYRCATDYPSL